MNKESLIKALNEIDEKYIIEADPDRKIEKERNARLIQFKKYSSTIVALAACFALFISVKNVLPNNTTPETTNLSERTKQVIEVPNNSIEDVGNNPVGSSGDVPSIGIFTAPCEADESELLDNTSTHEIDFEKIKNIFNINSINFPSDYLVEDNSIVVDSDSTCELIIEHNDIEYRLKLKKNMESTEGNISDIDMNGIVTTTIHDSSDINAVPSMTVEYDDTNSVAYGEWNGTCFSISANISCDIYEDACAIITSFTFN